METGQKERVSECLDKMYIMFARELLPKESHRPCQRSSQSFFPGCSFQGAVAWAAGRCLSEMLVPWGRLCKAQNAGEAPHNDAPLAVPKGLCRVVSPLTWCFSVSTTWTSILLRTPRILSAQAALMQYHGWGTETEECISS